ARRVCRGLGVAVVGAGSGGGRSRAGSWSWLCGCRRVGGSVGRGWVCRRRCRVCRSCGLAEPACCFGLTAEVEQVVGVVPAGLAGVVVFPGCGVWVLVLGSAAEPVDAALGDDRP